MIKPDSKDINISFNPIYSIGSKSQDNESSNHIMGEGLI